MKFNHITPFAKKVQSSTDLDYLRNLLNTGCRRVRKLAGVRVRELVNELDAHKLELKQMSGN